jgi:acyl-CoA hydrolase
VARTQGDIDLVLGWCLEPPGGVDFRAYRKVSTIMGGYGLRAGVAEGLVHYVPSRLGSTPALLQGALRPDVVVVSVRPGQHGWAFGTEVAWMPAAIRAGATVVAEVNHGLPAASAVDELSRDDVHVMAEVERPPIEFPSAPQDDTLAAIGAHVAGLIPEAAVVQWGPGGVADASVRAIRAPVYVDSGVLTDAVLDLWQRGLLLGRPTAAYLAGTPDLYHWADGQPLLHPLEFTHDVSRLAARPLFAINTALEIDLFGQVNVEAVGGRAIAGIGGHADYTLAGSRAERGLSIVALPSVYRGQPTLVEKLQAPASTSRADVDVVVTEHGTADLRGLPDDERRQRLVDLWRPATC